MMSRYRNRRLRVFALLAVVIASGVAIVSDAAAQGGRGRGRTPEFLPN